MVDYEVASAETAQLLLGDGGSKSPAVATPGGLVHAVSPETPHETVCGVATDGMRLWALAWHVDDDSFNRCSPCTVLTTSMSGP
jgi:hypothetical protein